MSLDALKTLEREAERCHSNRLRYERAEEALAQHRNNGRELSAILDILRGDAVAKEALIEAVNQYRSDILRLAELRLAAKAREEKLSAAHKRAVIAASILPMPAGEGNG